MSKPIYTSNETAIKFSAGPAMAIRPMATGEKQSWVLLENGTCVAWREKRVNGVGIERYLQDKGYTPAPEGDRYAARLADLINVKESKKLVEEASQKQAQVLQETFGGQLCTYVPFDPKQPIQKCLVREPQSFVITAFDMLNEFASGAVSIQCDYDNPDLRIGDVQLSNGWLVGPDGDPDAMPRLSDYAQEIEWAAFVIANSGLARLDGEQCFVVNDNPAPNELFARGQMSLMMNDQPNDRIVFGVRFDDTLVVQYQRDNQILCEREGMVGNSTGISLGTVVGSIAAVILQAKALETPKRTKSTKAKKAA